MVAQPDIEQRDLFGIVQRGALDDRTGQQNRLQIGYGRNRSGPSDLKIDRQQPSQRLLGLELVGDGPTRRLGRIAEAVLKRETVDLDHDAVGCERQLLPGLIPTTDVLVDFVHVAAQGDLVRDFKSPLTGRHQAVVMRSGKSSPTSE